ncbi:MAG: hypothetical protein JWM57_3083 [Phycisphaerales bacterium]|nr:hypothetical protein [Phycisphaerales bacterium]
MVPHVLTKIKFAVREVSAFVGHSFSPDDRDLVDLILEFLKHLGVSSDTGRRPEPIGVTEKVKKRLQQAEIFIGIFTRRDQKSDGTFTTSPWVIEEKAMAISEGKRLLLFVENGVEKEIGGLQGDYEYVPLDRTDLGKALVHAMEYVLAVTTVPLSCKVDPSGNKVDFKFDLGALQGSLDDQIEKIRQDKVRYPNNPNVGLALARALEQKGDRRAGIGEIESIFRDFPNFSAGHHELAHMLERDSRVDDALLEFQRALDNEPGAVKHYRCYGRALYKRATSLTDLAAKNATLEKANRLLERAVAIGGDATRKEVQNDLFLIQDALKQFQLPVPLAVNTNVVLPKKRKKY